MTLFSVSVEKKNMSCDVCGDLDILQMTMELKLCATAQLVAMQNLGPTQISNFSRTAPNPSIKHMKRWRFESIKSNIPNFASTHELKSSGPHRNFDCGATSFQTSNLSCADRLFLRANKADHLTLSYIVKTN